MARDSLSAVAVRSSSKAGAPPPSLLRAPAGYAQWLAALKHTIAAARRHAVARVNTDLVALYWQIGREILDRQAKHGWGAKVIERLASDLRAAFPDMRGFSRTNLMYMRAFAEAWPDVPIRPGEP